MSPAIEDGDVITVEPVAEDPVKQGDIVLYHSRFDTAVIHRVIRLERSPSERCIVTRGDAASHNDVPGSWGGSDELSGSASGSKW